MTAAAAAAAVLAAVATYTGFLILTAAPAAGRDLRGAAVITGAALVAAGSYTLATTGAIPPTATAYAHGLTTQAPGGAP